MTEVAGILLAAGPSRRFGGFAKPLLELEGQPLIQRLATEASGSRLAHLWVVVGYQAERIGPLLAGRAASVVENPRWEEGQSSSVKAGLAALPPSTAAAMFLPVDQPYLTATEIDRLIERYEATGGPIVVPVHRGRRGAPVIFDSRLFDELARIEGDEGGRQLFDSHPEEIVEVELARSEPLEDVDTPEQYEAVAADPRFARPRRPSAPATTTNAVRFEIAPPSERDEIAAALATVRLEISDYFGGLHPEVFVAPQGRHWSPEGHLRHLVKSVKPVAEALSRPKLILGLLFGRSRSASRSYDEIVELYREALLDGAQAGRYAPSRRDEALSPAEWQKLQLERWSSTGEALEKALGGWSEKALDRYRLPHPVLGKMTVREILYFTLYHNAHHARRVRERAAVPSNEPSNEPRSSE